MLLQQKAFREPQLFRELFCGEAEAFCGEAEAEQIITPLVTSFHVFTQISCFACDVVRVAKVSGC